jgi:hypothetical protein
MSSFDLYQTVTDQIVAMLETGVVPWRSPILGRSKAGHPKNLNTGKNYRGVNVFLLAMVVHSKGFGSSIRLGRIAALVLLWLAIALLIMFFFGVAENFDDMLRYMLIWVLVVALHRIRSLRTKKQGRIIHSRYVGDSWLASKLSPRAKLKRIHGSIEPALTLLAAIILFPFSLTVGKYLFFGGFAVAIFNLMVRSVMENRVRQMRDAHIEQQATARAFRGQDGEF